MKQRVKILREDDAFLYVAKPAGLPVHGGANQSGRTLLDILAETHGPELFLVHRLDKDTSGGMIVAKSKGVARRTQELWDRYQKIYLAMTKGVLSEDRTIAAPLFDKEGKRMPAETRVTPLDATDEVSLVMARIDTGRKHQIRLHLASIDHPILMDDKHGDFRENKRWSRAVRDAGAPRPKQTMLHAYRLEGPHPNGGEVQLVTPPPEAWIETWRACGGRVDALQHLA